MPSDDLLLYFQRDLALVGHWWLNGTHYAKTCEAWLAKLDSNARAAREVTAAVYGAAQATRWFVNWRLFYIACAELFAYGGGDQWAVSHYLFEKPTYAMIASRASDGGGAASAAAAAAAPAPMGGGGAGAGVGAAASRGGGGGGGVRGGAARRHPV